MLLYFALLGIQQEVWFLAVINEKLFVYGVEHFFSSLVNNALVNKI